MQQRIESDRAARIDAERRLDDAMSKYEAAMAAGTSDVDASRRQVEDAEISLRAVQERERLNQAAMDTEISTLRSDIQSAQNQPDANATIVAQRQADIIRRQSELEAYRHEVQEDASRRADIQRRHEAAISAAQQQRQQAEAQAQALRQQMEQAQQAAQQAAQAAQAAQQQTQQTQQQLQTLQQQSQQTQQQLQQQAQQSAAEAEKARQQAAASQSELERTRQELARRDTDARRKEMEAELAKLAKTRTETNRFIVTLPGIFFDTGKTQLKPGAKSTLAKIATQLKSDPTIKISVEGHTDSMGKSEKNQELSQKRAEAVRDFLVSQGVAADRITAAGKGQSEPVATNKTVAGRQQNRRVELVLGM
jgi:outer membrane protein OmpA-like peptidoglycan-associated protein